MDLSVSDRCCCQENVKRMFQKCRGDRLSLVSLECSDGTPKKEGNWELGADICEVRICSLIFIKPQQVS